MNYSRVNASVYGKAFTYAREVSPRIEEYTSAWDGREASFYLHADARSGFAITPDGELCLLFSLVPGRGNDMMERAVWFGANHLDCFDGYLPGLYARHGFVEIWREPNWTPGGPDVVYMARV